MDDFDREFQKLANDVDALAWKGGTSPSYRGQGVSTAWLGVFYWLLLAVIQVASILLIPLALFWVVRFLLTLMGY